MRLGKITDVIVDQSSTYILAFEVALTRSVMRDLGLKKIFGNTRVAFALSMIKGIGDVVTLKFTIAELRELVKAGVPELKNVQRISEGRVSF